jgi:hypothetical protein
MIIFYALAALALAQRAASHAGEGAVLVLCQF